MYIHIISKIMLDSQVNNADNEHTTKHKADLPTVTWYFLRLNYAGVKSSYLLSLPRLTSYGGLIGQNKRPSGNMPSRLYAVVETRQPLFGLVSLTKHKGVQPMHTITSIIQKLSIFTPIESLVLGFILGLPIACLVFGILAVMGV